MQMPTNKALPVRAAHTGSRIRRSPSEDDIYDDGCLRVEHDNYYVECKGEIVRLPRTEFLMFSRLARVPDRFVPSEAIWRAAWGDRRAYNADSLHVHMYRLRRRFASFGFHIDNMVGVGYRLSPGSCCADESEGKEQPLPRSC